MSGNNVARTTITRTKVSLTSYSAPLFINDGGDWLYVEEVGWASGGNYGKLLIARDGESSQEYMNRQVVKGSFASLNLYGLCHATIVYGLGDPPPDIFPQYESLSSWIALPDVTLPDPDYGKVVDLWSNDSGSVSGSLRAAEFMVNVLTAGADVRLCSTDTANAGVQLPVGQVFTFKVQGQVSPCLALRNNNGVAPVKVSVSYRKIDG
jgi:hypothetical protein